MIGRDALQIGSILRICERHLPMRGNPAALAALDEALHDAVGKALNVPVHALLGGVCGDRAAPEWFVGHAGEKHLIEEAVVAVETSAPNYNSEDSKEGPRAFNEKREPVRKESKAGQCNFPVG